MSKTIVIKSNQPWFFDKFDNVFPYFRYYNLPLRVFRKITKRLNIFIFEPLFYGKWKKEIRNCDLVVIFDNEIEYIDFLSRYIKKRNPNIKIVFWYWNPVDTFNVVVKKGLFIDEVWTYNERDAKKYHLKYNPQFYSPVPLNKSNGMKSDLFFVGKNKGRTSILKGISEEASRQGLKCNFHVVDTKKQAVSHWQYLADLACSKGIVEVITKPGGLTLRTLEALFYQKKLITNNEDIIKYDFYHKNNVFIVGKDDILKLGDFIKKPFVKISQEILDYYSFDSWLKRIEDGVETKI